MSFLRPPFLFVGRLHGSVLLCCLILLLILRRLRDRRLDRVQLLLSQRMFFAGLEFIIHLGTHPCIGCGIHLLSGGKLISLPIRKLLGLGNLAPEYNRRHLFHALVPYAPLPGYLLQVHEALGGEFAVHLQTSYVVVNGSSNLEYGRIGKNRAHQAPHTQLIDSKQESPILARELKQKYPQKTLWMYTGFVWDEVDDLPVMRDIDVLVDGEFVKALKDDQLHWKGSSNQRVIDVKKTRESGHIILWD